MDNKKVKKLIELSNMFECDFARVKRGICKRGDIVFKVDYGSFEKAEGLIGLSISECFDEYGWIVFRNK
jgi:hypothetical protein